MRITVLLVLVLAASAAIFVEFAEGKEKQAEKKEDHKVAEQQKLAKVTEVAEEDEQGATDNIKKGWFGRRRRGSRRRHYHCKPHCRYEEWSCWSRCRYGKQERSRTSRSVCGAKHCCDDKQYRKCYSAAKVFTFTACEDERKTINCGARLIQVVKAYYGRTNRYECSKPPKPVRNTNCRASHSENMIRNACDGKHSCFLEAANRVYGDPCKGTFKYIKVYYKCVTPNANTVGTLHICERATGSISCPYGFKIRLLSAYYGRTNRAVCSRKKSIRLIKNTSCRSQGGIDYRIHNKCQGRKVCHLRATNSEFGDPCRGTFKYIEVKYKCETKRMNGGWSKWSSWGACSKKCGGGTRTRTRKCNNPKPAYGGRYCYGSSVQRSKCNTHACTQKVNGGWSKWSSWGACSKRCGGGTRTRTRKCNNPKPAYGGRYCYGSSVQRRKCYTHACTQEYGYTNKGCYKDRSKRALQERIFKKSGKLRPEVEVRALCAKEADIHGYKCFGLQNGGECWASKSAESYKKYGKSQSCKEDGLGGPWANEVYCFGDCFSKWSGWTTCYAKKQQRARYCNHKCDVCQGHLQEVKDCK